MTDEAPAATPAAQPASPEPQGAPASDAGALELRDSAGHRRGASRQG